MKKRMRCQGIIPECAYRSNTWGWRCHHFSVETIAGYNLCRSHAEMLRVGAEIAVDTEPTKC